MENTYTAFDGTSKVAAGSIRDVVLTTHSWAREHPQSSVLVFQDQTGRVIDLDLRGDPDEVLDQLVDHPMLEPVVVVAEPVPRGRGRPKLGVVSREVSLLPRHWEWIRGQPKSASATIRTLVEERMKAGAAGDEERRRANVTYGVMTALAGDLPGFEEASRALFARDRPRFLALIVDWPTDVRDYVSGLAKK